MPDLVTHFYFAETVRGTLERPVNVSLWDGVFAHAAAGPDIWFTMLLAGAKKRPLNERGNFMHENKTGAFLTALAREAGEATDKDELFSYLAGFLCHYALDSITHPYIVAKTGDYRGSEDTLRFRGNHMRLERAIDCLIIRSYYAQEPWRFPFLRRVLPLRRLPPSMKTPLDRAYASVYGWENVWEDLNRAIACQRRFYRLVQDPTGAVNRLAGRLDNGKSHTDLGEISYHGRDIDNGKTDYLNLSHQPWRHPYAPETVSVQSFPELFDAARERAGRLIEAAWRCVYLAGEEDLAALIGNLSYSTGLDCDDPRSSLPPVAEPIF